MVSPKPRPRRGGAKAAPQCSPSVQPPRGALTTSHPDSLPVSLSPAVGGPSGTESLVCASSTPSHSLATRPHPCSLHSDEVQNPERASMTVPPEGSTQPLRSSRSLPIPTASLVSVRTWPCLIPPTAETVAWSGSPWLRPSLLSVGVRDAALSTPVSSASRTGVCFRVGH